jgi:hypothetical protein
MPMVLENMSKNTLKDIKGCHEGHDKASPNFCPNKKGNHRFFLKTFGRDTRRHQVGLS